MYESDMLTAYYWISSASLHPPTSVAHSAGFANVFAWLVLGFRCAPPQALRCHPLRGLKEFSSPVDADEPALWSSRPSFRRNLVGIV